MVLKELILNSFYFGRVLWSWKNWFWRVSTLGGCDGLERTDFEQFRLWEGVVVGCGGLERIDFEQFLLWEGVMVLKELILDIFYFGRVWQSWKNWFWRVSTLGGCDGLKELILDSLYFVRVWWEGGLERTDFEQFLLWKGVMVLKELILNNFHFVRVWWSWRNWFWRSFYFVRVWW